MKYFYIVTNRFKDPDGVNTRKIAHFLRSKGAECVCQIEQEQAFNKTGSYSDEDWFLIILNVLLFLEVTVHLFRHQGSCLRRIFLL